MTIQAKKGLQLGEAKGSALAKALRQLVDIIDEGVPDRPPWTEQMRELDAGRDLVLVLTDESAPNTISRYPAQVTDRLRDLPDGVPLADIPTNRDEKRALHVIRGHLADFWREDHGRELGDPEFRRLASILSVRAMSLTDGGSDQVATQILLSDLTGSPEQGPHSRQADSDPDYILHW